MKAKYEILIREAIKSKKLSYSPYSNLKIGVSLLAGSGKIYKGANIECASFSLTICAERVVFSKALTEGEKTFDTIAIASSKRDYIYPCGACRQFMYEFSENLKIILVKSVNEYRIFSLRSLLPKSFRLKN